MNWRAEETLGPITDVVTDDDGVVATVYGGGGYSAMKRARVIAAAPKMLNALGRALFHATLRGWGTTEDHELREVYDQMKAAIAEAEGK